MNLKNISGVWNLFVFKQVELPNIYKYIGFRFDMNRPYTNRLLATIFIIKILEDVLSDKNYL